MSKEKDVKKNEPKTKVELKSDPSVSIRKMR
jgi:hypothetical protein